MIRDKQADYTVERRGEGSREIRMSLDENSLVHLMTVLTDLYSDPTMAVIREYATNAYDSHIEAGISVPIEVTLPTFLAPFFKIKDYGVGLSGDDIAEIYSKYGATTKGETNNQVGMLGLGCKSALTYTNQFTLVGIKNGVRTMVSISRDGDGIGSMTIVDEDETDQASGVEVIIPTKSGEEQDFRERVEDFFSWWPEGSVLINEKPPLSFKEIHTTSLSQVTDSIWLNRVNVSRLIMGNVAYPLDLAYLGDDVNFRNCGLIVFAPIGSVHFAPSRELLQYTSKTVAYLQTIMAELRVGLPAIIQADIEAAAEPHEAASRKLQWWANIPGDLLPLSAFYKGEEIPDTFDFHDQHVIMSASNSFKKSEYSTVRLTSLSHLAQSVLVCDFARSFTPSVKKKLNEWIRLQAREAPKYFVLGPSFDIKWISADQQVSWLEVDQIKFVYARKGAFREGRVYGSYDGYVDGVFTHNIDASAIDRTHPICYGPSGGPYHRVLESCLDKYTAINLSHNRREKFLRLFPEARPIEEIARECAETWIESLSSRELRALAFRDYGGYTERYSTFRVEDPQLREAIELARYRRTPEYVRVCDQGRIFGNLFVLPESVAPPVAPGWDRYPLVNVYDRPTDHTYLYLNAAYNHLYKEQECQANCS